MRMQERPKLNLKITPLELIFNVGTLTLFIGNMIYLLYIWGTLPAEVPAHYNFAGEVDRWGSKWEMIIIPILIIIIWIGITILERYPHVYNYLNLTKDNVRGQYLNARLMMNVIKNITSLIFIYIIWKDVQVALGKDQSLGPWFLLSFFVLLFVPMGYFIIKSFRINK